MRDRPFTLHSGGLSVFPLNEERQPMVMFVNYLDKAEAELIGRRKNDETKYRIAHVDVATCP